MTLDSLSGKAGMSTVRSDRERSRLEVSMPVGLCGALCAPWTVAALISSSHPKTPLPELQQERRVSRHYDRAPSCSCLKNDCMLTPQHSVNARRCARLVGYRDRD